MPSSSAAAPHCRSFLETRFWEEVPLHRQIMSAWKASNRVASRFVSLALKHPQVARYARRRPCPSPGTVEHPDDDQTIADRTSARQRFRSQIAR
jgi:hypothetical protein